MSDPKNKYNDTFVDDCGVEHHIDDFRPSEDEQLEPGQCICGAFECNNGKPINVLVKADCETS